MLPLVLRSLRIIGVLLFAASLSACSAIKLGYNNLPDLAYWWLDGYLDFNDEQDTRVRAELARLHAWHRANELPRLADLLGRMEDLAPQAITAAQACSQVAEVQARLNVAADEAEPAVVAVALSLTPKQLRHLERKYARSNADFRKDWIDVDAAEVADKRFRQTLERLEMIYNRLDDPQRTVLRQKIAQSAFDARRVLTIREHRQQDLLQILRKLQETRPPAAEARTLLRGYLERVQRPLDPAERRYQDGLLEEGCRIFAAVHDSTTPAQREQAARRLRAYQRDLRELAEQR